MLGIGLYLGLRREDNMGRQGHTWEQIVRARREAEVELAEGNIVVEWCRGGESNPHGPKPAGF
jgi:hypothetical protein